MSMIEKMARAMCEDFDSLPLTEAERDRAHSTHLLSQETVRAMLTRALSALEEPSEAMVEAGERDLPLSDVDDIRFAFGSMIRAAKDES